MFLLELRMANLEQFIINHWPWCLLWLAIFALIILNEYWNEKKKANALTPAAVVDLMNNEDAVLIDIRDMNAYKEGHIIHAIQASADDFKKERLHKYKQKPLILVCAQGLTASSLAATLPTLGFENVAILAGGMQAWNQAGLPLVKK